MADWTGIRQAIAAKCGNVAGINHASADDIDAAPDTPAVLVTHMSSINVTERGASYEKREASANGLLFVSRAPGTGEAMAKADGLVELLFNEFLTGIQLGYPGVVQDSALESAEADVLEIAGVEYIGYRLTFAVVVRETVERSAD